MSRSTLAILSTDNLINNLNEVKKRAPRSSIIAMVKANAFGHGLRSAAIRLQNHVDNLGVASIDEALALRSVGIKCHITLMEGVFEPDELLVASCQKFDVVIHDFNQVMWLKKAKFPSPIKVWLKLDSGMSRLGFTCQEIIKALNILQESQNIKSEIGLMSHFSCADDPNNDFNNTQLNTFSKLAKNWQGPKSIANSAAIFGLPASHYDVVRPGICLYGGSPLKNIKASELGLKPVMTLQTRLTALKKISREQKVGYGARYTAHQNMMIGIIAIGYGDGYPRGLRTGTPLLVNGARCSTIGTISMDMTAIDLTNAENPQIGDQVILWGDELPIEEIITNTSLINHEVLCGVQARVKFHWTVH